MVDTQDRGVGNCLLQFIFYLRDFHLASCAGTIDIGAIDSHAYTRFQTSRIIYSESFSERRVSTIRANLPSV